MLLNAFRRVFIPLCIAAVFIYLGIIAAPVRAEPSLEGDGLLRTQSTYSVAETAERLRADVESKGILFFQTIDQSALAAEAGVDLPPSSLIIFGHPPLGTLFLTSNSMSGLDWPVRVQIYEDENGQVWTVYQDWDWVAARYGITDRQAEFDMATEAVASFMASIANCDPVADCTERSSSAAE